jgi:hypothetical protein
MEAELRALIVLGLTGLLVLLRRDAVRFGTAEYDDESAPGGWRTGLVRLAWYAVGLGLAAALFAVHPSPSEALNLGVGDDRATAIALGLLFGLGGAVVAAGYAWLRYGRLRLPAARTYPGAILNSVCTAFIDEVAFRGAILGLLLATGLPAVWAIIIQDLLYGLTTRLGAPGRSRAMLLVSLGVGAVAGVLTVATGGIGAAVLGHSITRFSIFVCTGHAGQVRPQGQEPEEAAADRLPPDGWQVVGEGESAPDGGQG